jgi:hypothetical protein
MKSMTSLRFASFTKRIRTMKISGLENIFYCDHYRPSPSRLRDWISSKSTGYEALHYCNGTKGRWVEVQVRSERMRLQRKDMQLITNIKCHTRRRID